MKLTSNKIFSFMLAAAFALTLAGCGGGGGTAAVEEEPPAMPEPTAQEMCEGDGGRYNADGSCTSAADLAEEMALSGAQDAASAAAAAAMMAVGGAVDPVAASNAYGYAKMAAEASEAADAATTSADAMGHQMAAETARDKAMEAAGTTGLGLIMLANKVLNGDDIENAELDGSTPPKAINNATNVGAAIAAAGAATTTTGFTNQGGMSGTDTQLTISQDGTNAVVVHKAGGSAFEVQIGTTDLQQGEEPSRFHIKGNEAQDLLLVDATDDTKKTHLVITTDIEASSKEDAYTQTDATDPDVVVDSVVIGDVPNDGSDFVVSYNSDPDDNNAPVTGQFYCPDTETCSISVDEDGKVVAVTNYQFTSTKASVTENDSDYMAWGYWAQASIRDSVTVGTDNIDAQAGAFAYGSQAFAVVSGIAGKASYEGSASGLYSAGGMIQYFDADASLEVDFGGATNTDPLATISGSISGIKAGGQDVDGSLDLVKANVVAAGSFTGTTDGILGGNGLRGNWGGQLYGPAARNAAATATTHPTGVAGTFGASSADNKMGLIGSFGAHRQ